MRFLVDELSKIDVLGIVETSLEKLSAQGAPWNIAEFLKAEGIKGQSGAYNCPVAVYVNRELGLSDDIWSVVMVNCLAVAVPRAAVRVPIPGNVGAFTSDYDRGAFEELRGK